MWTTFSIAARLLLCAAVLVSGSKPVAMRHAHADGDIPHAHGRYACEHPRSRVAHHRGHDHHHHDGDEAHDAVLSLGAGAVVWHVHVWVLGFELTWPVSPDSQTEDEAPEPVIVSLAESELLPPGLSPAKYGVVSDECLPAKLADNSGFLRSDRRIQPAEDWPSSPPLCDTARHERSGVQLI